MQLVLQATVCDCLSFDPFAFEEDGLSPSEVDVGRREIGQALVVSRMVVLRHEGRAAALARLTEEASRQGASGVAGVTGNSGPSGAARR